jgi:hypothetical protein
MLERVNAHTAGFPSPATRRPDRTFALTLFYDIAMEIIIKKKLKK